MATIVTRAGKGSPLTNVEVDANFTNLNNELGQKLVASDLTPYLTSANAASTYQTILTSGTTIKTVNGVSVLGSGDIQIDGGVSSFNTRTGAVTLSSGDVTTALGFTPYNATNPSGYITSSSLASYLPLSGGTLTGLLTGFTSSMSMTQDSGATQGSLVCRASGAGDANLAGMSFWNDAYAIKMGIRADGYFGLGGWSRGAWSWYSAPNGDMVAAGNVTAYSDERLKKNWRDMPDDFIELLSRVKCGIYDRIDEDGLTQVGVSAQSLQAVIPHGVVTGLEGTLTVAYGNAALVSAVKLAERVIQLENKIDNILASMNTQR